MESVKLSVKTVQSILNYLAVQPYNEVASIINAIQMEASVKEDQPTTEDTISK